MSPTVPPSVYDAARVAELLGIEYSAEQLAAFGPPPEPLAGFVTFFDPGWSILRLRQAVADKGTIFYPQTWYDTHPFAQRADQPRYRQIRSEALPGSYDKPFAEQQALLAEGEEVPTGRILVMGMVVHFLATGQYLFPDCYVRCADQVTSGRQVGFSDFDDSGLYVSAHLGDDRGESVGLAVSRKF